MVSSRDKWELVHRFRQAVANGHALPIRCPDCESEMVPVAGRDDDPAFKCFYCRATYIVGLNVYDQMVAAMREAVDLARDFEENEDFE